MTTAVRLGGFALLLAGAFGVAALGGSALGPEPRTEEPVATDHSAGAEHGGEKPHAATGAAPVAVRGLSGADRGLRLLLDRRELSRGRQAPLGLRILDAEGRTVRDFDVEHTRRMHLIVVRRDLTGFQHLHPRQGPDGRWETPLRLDAAGSYRVFADFARRGEAHTLAADVHVDGRADLLDLPAPRPTAVSDGGYDVRLRAADVQPGRPAALRFSITRGGRPVHVEPYLGAGGHLVALREGDLAFLHVHPVENGHGAEGGGHDDAVAFEATFPTAGRYRLFLQFRHAGRVQTVAFTQEVA